MKLNYLKTGGVKGRIKSEGLRTSRRFLEAFDREIDVLIGKYVRMARADRMRTVMAIHIELPGVIAKLSGRRA